MVTSQKSIVPGLITGTALLLTVSCGAIPEKVTGEETAGAVELQIRIADTPQMPAKRIATDFDSLVVEVGGEGVSAQRFVRAIDPLQLYFIDTLPVPAGDRRSISVSTVNRAGEVIHEDSAGTRIVHIDPAVMTLLHVVLLPLRGSVFLQIGGVPTAVDSLAAVFTSTEGNQWRGKVGRRPKISLSLDGIPHATRGRLEVFCITVNGDTLYRAEAELEVNARSLNSIELSFEAASSSVSLTGTLQLPGATVATGGFGSMIKTGEETGELIISEIMYAANDSEYIEVFNPEEEEAVFDTLYIEVDGTRRLFTGITIPARSHFVFGRCVLPWVDIAHPAAGALDLSGNGNWIGILNREGLMIDQVIFTGGGNDLEWPDVRGKSSICLDAGGYSGMANNYGRYWKEATETIQGAPGQSGTPHE